MKIGLIKWFFKNDALTLAVKADYEKRKLTDFSDPSLDERVKHIFNQHFEGTWFEDSRKSAIKSTLVSLILKDESLKTYALQFKDPTPPSKRIANELWNIRIDDLKRQIDDLKPILFGGISPESLKSIITQLKNNEEDLEGYVFRPISLLHLSRNMPLELDGTNCIFLCVRLSDKELQNKIKNLPLIKNTPDLLNKFTNDELELINLVQR